MNKITLFLLLPRSVRTSDPKVREPPTVKKALERIRTGVIAAGKRAMGSALTLPPISPRDLLEGTCLRFDTEESGALRADDLRQVLRIFPSVHRFANHFKTLFPKWKQVVSHHLLF